MNNQVGTAPITADNRSSEPNGDDQTYLDWRHRVQARVEAALAANPNLRLFTTTLMHEHAVFDHYLAAFKPGADRQYHNCASCRQFFDRYGGLATINEAGNLESFMWDPKDAPWQYRDSIEQIIEATKRSRVTGVFVSSEPRWGTPRTRVNLGGAWNHMAVHPPRNLVYKQPAGGLNAEQRVALYEQEVGMVARTLADFGERVVDQAVRLLESDALYRAEKTLGPAKWLQALHKAIRAARATGFGDAGNTKTNLIWRAVASAPVGFAHIRSGVLGTLLQDLADGNPFDEVAGRFAAKMKADSYQRPKAAPKAGNIEQAEKLFEAMGLAPALRRRYATLADVVPLWVPNPPESNAEARSRRAGGVFASVQARGTDYPAQPSASSMPPAQTMTWAKFAKKVLPSAACIHMLVPSGRTSFGALVTAADPTAPPILQWDSLDQRNPTSWYVYTSGSNASDWGLRAGEYVLVTVICDKPPKWYGDQKFAHMGDNVMLCLDGAKDRSGGRSLALFPELLRSELHGVRSVIEAYSNNGKLEPLPAGAPLASGFIFGGKEDKSIRLRVADTTNQHMDYVIDRME